MSKELWERHKVSAGLDFRRSFQIQQENYSETPFALNLSDHRQTTVISPYLTSEWALRTNLHFHAGARLDYYDQNTHSANPRLGLVWQPVSATVLKALYGTAFRAPNAYELYYHDGYVTQKPAVNLRPETVDTYELVWEQALGRRWQFSASGYFYRINDAIQQDPDPADGLLVYRNTGPNTGRGVETELAYKAEKGFQSRLSYALQTTEDRMTGGTLSNSPRHLARWQNTLPLYLDKVFLSTELAFTSAVQTTPATASRVGEYWLLNSTLYTRELARGWSASVSVYNLLDRRYGHPVGDEIRFGQILQDGRSFQFKLSLRF